MAREMAPAVKERSKERARGGDYGGGEVEGGAIKREGGGGDGARGGRGNGGQDQEPSRRTVLADPEKESSLYMYWAVDVRYGALVLWRIRHGTQASVGYTASQPAPPVCSLHGMENLTGPIEIKWHDTTSYAVPCHVARRAVLRASSDSDSDSAALTQRRCSRRMPRPSPLGGSAQRAFNKQ